MRRWIMRGSQHKDLLLDIDVQGALQVMQRAAGGGFDFYFAAEPGGAGDAACGIAARQKV